MARVIGGLIGGLAVALAALFGVGWVNQLLYPGLGDMPMNDKARLGEMMLALPIGAQLIVALAWLVGALVGGWVAGAISRRNWTVWAIAGVVAVIAIGSIVMVSYPLLLNVAAVVAPLIGGYLATLLLRRTPSAGMGAPM